MTSPGRSGPVRVQLSRAKGWRMPENTVKVDRTTKWGNPFKVGEDGTAAECVELYRLLLSGYVCLSGTASIELQNKSRAVVVACRDELRGKSLACWCRSDKTIPEFTVVDGREAMEMPWATLAELCEAIPPAYTRFIGAQLLPLVQSGKARWLDFMAATKTGAAA